MQTKIQSQLEDQKIKSTNHRLSLPEVKTSVSKISTDNSNLEALRNDLSSMKEIFFESALNRDMAIAQINTSLQNNVNTDKNQQLAQLSSTEYNSPLNEGKRTIIDSTERAEEKKQKRFNERKYSIIELFETEKAFCTELTELYHVFMNDDQSVYIFKLFI